MNVEGFQVQGFGHYRSRFYWSVWILFLGVFTAAVCSSHAPTHEHDVPHPPLCIDVGSVVMRGDRSTILFANEGSFPLPPKFLAFIVSSGILSSFLLVDIKRFAPPFSPSFEQTFRNPPRVSLAVLRL